MHVQMVHSLRSAPVATGRLAARTPVRAALRNATHAVHERMHHLEPFQAILEKRLTLHWYLPMLQSLLVYHSAIAATAARYGWANLSSGTRRSALLEADLRSIGGIPIEHSVDWRPGTREAVLGALYAAEGSMLGGRVIAGQLDYLLGSEPEGRSFFIGSADDGANWRKLISVLEARCTAPEDLERTVEGALFGFNLFEQCVIH